MRITDSIVYDSMNRLVQQNRSDYLDKQLRVSSGKKFLNRSESPSDAAALAEVNATQSRNNQWVDNAEEAVTWSKLTDAKMDDLLSHIQRANELTIQANNETLAPDDYKNIAQEINSILDAVIESANSKIQGVYTFAGTNTGSAPYTTTDTDGDGNVDTVTGNITNWEKRKVQISETQTSEYGLVAGGDEGVFENSGLSSSLFDSLIQLRDDLEAGNSPTNADNVQEAMEHVVTKLTENGIQQQRFKRLQENITVSQDVLTQQKSTLQDADLAEELVDLSELEAAFQASLQMTSRISNLSLVNML